MTTLSLFHRRMDRRLPIIPVRAYDFRFHPGTCSLLFAPSMGRSNTKPLEPHSSFWMIIVDFSSSWCILQFDRPLHAHAAKERNTTWSCRCIGKLEVVWNPQKLITSGRRHFVGCFQIRPPESTFGEVQTIIRHQMKRHLNVTAISVGIHGVEQWKIQVNRR